ncbi:MAG: hypothetical protein ACREJ6_02865, partial [Candidatus Methylomirabilis sp.]
MIILAAILAFVGTVLAVTVLLALLVPTPDPHLVRVRQLGAAARSTEPVELTSARRQGRVGTRVEQIAVRLGRTISGQDPKTQSKWGKRLV